MPYDPVTHQFVPQKVGANVVTDSNGVAYDPTPVGGSGGGGGGGLSTNDGTFAKETGGNLASILAALGTISDTAWSGSGNATIDAALKAIYALLVTSNTNTAALGTQTTLAAAKADLDTIVTQTNGVATQTTLAAAKTDLDSILTNTTGLATQTTLAAAKTDLDTIVTNTNKIPASPAQEAGNLATIATNTTGLATQATAAAAKTDLDTLAAAVTSNKVQVQQQASISVSGTLQSAATAAGNGTTLNVLGESACIFTVSGTYTGLTVNFEGSEDGTTYSALSTTQLGTTTIATTAASNGLYECSVAGLQLVRARLTASSPTGNITVTGHTVPVNFATRVIQANQAGTWNTNILGSPDGGSTFKNILTAISGAIIAQVNLQAGNQLTGYSGTYREGVPLGIAGTQRILTSTKTLTTGQQTFTWTDQNGSSYTTTPSGKSFYISSIDVTCDPGTTAGTPQTSLFQLFQNNTGNVLYEYYASNNSPSRQLAMPLVLVGGNAVLAKCGASNLGTPVGSIYVTLTGWEI